MQSFKDIIDYQLFLQHINWSQKFDAPIVHAWRVSKGKLVKVDLFSSSAIPDRLPSPEDLMQGMIQI